ncbi:MAG: SDR family NAD(P)-dependent oxidoreductase, partial [Alphaproteobacteria bacterium]|nr:SDR family NAD(P)-dependent oxidoreductase [Alphaproteobacteria bacterium]
MKSWLTSNTNEAAGDTDGDGDDTSADDTAPPASDVFSSSLLEHFYCASPLARSQISRIMAALNEVVGKWPDGRPLRILQLGVAAGGLTRAVLPLLTGQTDRLNRASLTIADTSEPRIARIANLHNRTPGLEAVHVSANLDELEPFGPFDVVVSANGLHQLENYGVLLTALRRHMADGALAIVSETEPAAFHDIVFAGTRGWFDTAVADGVASGRLRDRTSWGGALEAAGFATPSPLGREEKPLHVPGSSFIIAQRPMVEKFDGRAVEGTARDEPASRAALIIPASGEALTFAAGLAATLAAAGSEAQISETRFEPTAAASGRDGKDAATSDLDALFARSNTLPPDIVYVSPASPGDADPERELLAQTAHLTTLLNTIGDRDARLWIIAEGGARAVAGLGPASPVQSGLWGYGRTAINECAHLDIRLVDISAELAPADAGVRIASLLREPGDLRELVVAPSALHGLQVHRGPPPATAAKAPASETETAATVLELAQTGDLEALTWVARNRRSPSAGEVEIEIAATGLNFRDVMWSLGLLPEEALEDGFAGPTVGFECSGRVVRIGDGVTGLRPGDPVIAMAPACFASHVTVTTDAVARLPDNIRLEDAASIPVAFLTAYYALEHLARLRKNEWVLIHGAAGGVGLAAVQIARQVGARVIATAGTDEKRAVLATLGAEHILDTRSLEFADQVRTITGGGVDVLLNSLAGEAMERSIDLMRPFGRFLELGKRDFYANTKVGLRPFRRNVSYFGIDADQLLTYRPDVVRTVFGEIMDGFADGTYTPLPHRVFDDSSIVDAFRLMQKSGHIGKIIVRAPPATAGIEFTKREFSARADGTHILVGGTGGFGLEMARWLADRGARHIVLTSRSGGGGEALERLIRELAERGTSLKVAACDVTNSATLEALLMAERAERPIAGIAHTAMVLDDGLIRNLTAERIQAVLAPKVTGAANLDRLTRNDDLDYFLLFSSSAAMFGNPGQASYTAANGYLDGLARARVAQGFKGMAIAWGAISDVGVLTRQMDAAESLARHTGGIDFRARDGLNLLARLLVRDDCSTACANVALATMNWSMAGEMLKIMQTPAYALIRREAKSGGSDMVEQVDIRAAIQ